MESVAPDQRLDGRYVIEEHIATGGMASVWRARDEVLARTVAVKVLRADLAATEDFRERFRREAIAAARLNHPAIVSIFDTGSDGDVVYIVMEFFEGRTLADIRAERGRLEPQEAIDLLVPVLDALGYAHQNGIVHRDVKPANILVAPAGRVKVADFGIAKAALGHHDLTTTGKVLGTVRYLAPEQVEGVTVDGRADLYSTGVVLYELLTGRPPFDGETDIATAMMRLTTAPAPPRAIVPGLPRGLEGAVMRAMARHPEDRFPTAESMRDALERGTGSVAPLVLEPEPSPTTTLPRGEPSPSVARSYLLVPLIVVGIAAAVIVGGLALGRLQLGGPLGIRERSPGANGGGATIAIVSARDVDPFGDGAEHHDEVGLAIDGKPDTAWSTDHYSTAAFGQLKPGLGLLLSLGGEHEVSSVTVRGPITGWTFQLLPGTAGDPKATPLASTSGRTSFILPASGTLEIALRPARIPGLMIWITKLGPDEGRFAASVGEVTVTGSAS